MVFAFGLRQTHLFGSFFSSTLFNSINGVISICFDSYIITIIKVTRLRVRISKFRIKSIFMFFPLVWELHGYLDLFYFNIVYYYQWCHLNRYREISDNYQKSFKTKSKNFQIQEKVNLYGFSFWFKRNTVFGLTLLQHC